MNYSAKEVKLMHERYCGLIGRGQFEVYKCLVDGKLCALKLLEHHGSKEDIERVKKSLQNEVEALTRAKPSPFVVNLVGVVLYEFSSGVIMDYMPRGNLSDFLRDCRPSFVMRLKTLNEIAAGLEYLHHEISLCHAVSHNDLKPLNVVLDADFTAKICDFDGADVIARTSGIAPRKLQRIISCYTENYAAPELLDTIVQDSDMIERTRGMDVYSFSMIIYYVLTGQHPFGSVESCLVMNKYLNGERPRIDKYDFADTADMMTLLQSVTHLMKECWNENPRSRPKAQSIAFNFRNFMSQINKEQLSEEIATMKQNHPIPEEDHALYSKSFDEFCRRRNLRTFQDDHGTVTAEPPAANLCKATISDSVNYIEVNNLTVDPHVGGSIIIKSPTTMIKCTIVKVDNVTPGT